MKVAVAGGTPTKIADGVALFSWSRSGDIVFTRGGGPRPQLFRVSDAGGPVESITPPPQPNETVYGSPCFLPDGDALLFTIVIAGRDSTELAAIRLSDRKIIRLGVAGLSPLYLSSGHVISVGFNSDLRLTPFDATHLRVTGPSETVLQNVLTKSATVAEIAVSSSGTLVYLPGQAARQIVEFDRGGQSRVITPMLRDFRFPRYSPDGRRIAVTIGQPPSMDVCASIASARSVFTTDGHSTTPSGRRTAVALRGPCQPAQTRGYGGAHGTEATRPHRSFRGAEASLSHRRVISSSQMSVVQPSSPPCGSTRLGRRQQLCRRRRRTRRSRPMANGWRTSRTRAEIWRLHPPASGPRVATIQYRMVEIRAVEPQGH